MDHTLTQDVGGVAEGKAESGALAWLGFRPDTAAMAVNDPRDGGQADAATLEFFGFVQALEGREDAVGVLHVEADAVVAHEEYPLSIDCFAAEFDLRRGFLAGVFPGVLQQVLHHDAQQLRVAEGRAAIFDRYLDGVGGRALLQFAEDIVCQLAQIGLAATHAAERPGVFLGAVNFVGGWLGEGCPAPSVNPLLFERAARFPSVTIWMYGENDTFYSMAHSRGNFAVFTNAGGKGTFNAYTRAAGLNGHNITNDPHLWTGHLQTYMESLGR